MSGLRVLLVVVLLVAGCGGTAVTAAPRASLARPSSGAESGAPATSSGGSFVAAPPSPGSIGATPPPSSPSGPSAPASVLVEHGDRTVAEVALTFDMGGRVGDALAIVRWLRDHDVHATIFLTGEESAGSTGRAILEAIGARPDLFALGNHSWSHPDVTTLGADAIREQLARTETEMRRWTAQSPRPLFRPPFGAWNDTVLTAAAAAGYSRTVTWDVDTRDWEPQSNDGPSADAIVSTVLGSVDSGSIVLCHLGGYHTLAALPRIVAGLHARGYRLVTLREMAGVL